MRINELISLTILNRENVKQLLLNTKHWHPTFFKYLPYANVWTFPEMLQLKPSLFKCYGNTNRTLTKQWSLTSWTEWSWRYGLYLKSQFCSQKVSVNKYVFLRLQTEWCYYCGSNQRFAKWFQHALLVFDRMAEWHICTQTHTLWKVSKPVMLCF